MATQNSINNTSNPLASTAVTVDPGASGDSYTQFSINGTGEFRFGVDDTDSDALVLSQGSALGTTNTFRMSAAGECTLPLQPSFVATATADLTNVTGDSTAYIVVFATESFDRGSDYDGTSTFTAPVAGLYYFNTGGQFSQLTTSFTAALINFFINSTTSIRGHYFNPAAGFQVSDEYVYNASIVLLLAAADTVEILVTVGGSTKTVDLLGGIATTSFSGYLLV